MPTKRCDVCGNPYATLLPCGDHWHYFCSSCARLSNQEVDKALNHQPTPVLKTEGDSE